MPSTSRPSNPLSWRGRNNEMKDLKAKELRDKSVPELEEMLAKERQDLFHARRDLVFRRITDTASLKVRRHNIARIITVIAASKGEVK
jgi:ribosomal protein L29